MTEDKGRTDAVAGPERVTFGSEDVVLTGEFRAARPGRPQPGVVLTGPFTGVKEQVVGTYARILAAAGFATIAFDHRGFGESGGRPGHEDSQGKLADLRAAVSVLAGRPGVDAARIGAVGVCLGGGYAVRAAAADPRVKAVAGIAGAYNSPALMLRAMGAGPYKSALAAALDGYDEYLPAVAPDGGEAAMGGEEPYAYYGTARSFSPHWRNRVTRGSLHSLMTFDALGAAELLADVPLLVVHGKTDAYCSPELAQALYERKPGEKEILWLDAGQHTDLYDSEPHVTRAAEATAVFLRRTLTPAGP
jgi:fermentation-respiration switch protein FrsA (DUF1100 family)